VKKNRKLFTEVKKFFIGQFVFLTHKLPPEGLGQVRARYSAPDLISVSCYG